LEGTYSVTVPPAPAYLRWLPAFLFRTDRIAERYVLKAWALALLPSLLLSGLHAWLVPGLRGPDFHTDIHRLPILLFLLIVVSPIVETLILLPMVLFLRRLFGTGPAVVASAVLWGVAHSLEAPGWGLVVWWPFLVMSVALLTWRAEGLGKALAVVVSIHALQNAVGGFLLLFAV
jgi:membrane protease YdiL (CAAX protease family)